MTKEYFGLTSKQKQVDIFTLKNSNGMQVKIINYGARVTSILAADRDMKFEDVVLGYDNLDDYLNDKFYFGAIIGRYANRINDGKFKIDNTEYTLSLNNGKNHLHGGFAGFDKVVWDACQVIDNEGVGVKLSYISRDGEEGYPGTLSLDVVYVLSDKNELIIKYKAKTDKATPINLTHHGYFNLTGNHQTNILKHKLFINADSYLPVNKNGIPSGQQNDVFASPFDFTKPGEIGERINAKHIQIEHGSGYDHNWIFNTTNGKLKLQATLSESVSGRLLEVYTAEPGIQFYSGNYLNGAETNSRFGFRYGLCLETQHFPDSPNHLSFPSTILRPGKIYRSQTIYRFLTE